jgi:hypothetical protein
MLPGSSGVWSTPSYQQDVVRANMTLLKICFALPAFNSQRFARSVMFGLRSINITASVTLLGSGGVWSTANYQQDVIYANMTYWTSALRFLPLTANGSLGASCSGSEALTSLRVRDFLAAVVSDLQQIISKMSSVQIRPYWTSALRFPPLTANGSLGVSCSDSEAFVLFLAFILFCISFIK